MDNFEILLDRNIRKIRDFPKKGILFYDITSLLMVPDVFNKIIDKMYNYYKNKNIDGIIAVESRGFLFASPLSLKLNVPLLLARKKGKLPGRTLSIEYSLEYGKEIIEIHEEDLNRVNNILIVDDLIATGGTLEAIAKIVEKTNCNVVGVFGVIGLPFLNYEEKLKKYDIKTFINYNSE